MSHIFISYARKHADWVNAILKKNLEDNNFKVWVDTFDIEAGKDWRNEIDNAIENCLVMLVVLSKEANKSKYVTYEWGHAIGAKKTVIPILLDELESMVDGDEQIHPRLSPVQYEDIRQFSKYDWTRLHALIRQASNVPELLLKLQEGSFQEKQNAIRQLGNLSDPTFLTNLLPLLNDENHIIRSSVIDALENINTSDAKQAIAKALLEDSNLDVKQKAASALGEIGDEQYIPHLIKALDTVDFGTSRTVERAIEEFGSKAVAPLIEGLHNKSYNIQKSTASILGNIGDIKALASLEEVFLDASQHSAVRETCMEAMTEIGNEEIISVLIKHVADPKIGRSVERIIEKFDKKASKYLVDALSEEDWKIRQKAVELLGAIKVEQAIPALSDLLQKDVLEVKQTVVQTLGDIRSATAIPILIKALDDPNLSSNFRSPETVLENYEFDAVGYLVEASTNLENSYRVRAGSVNVLGTILSRKRDLQDVDLSSLFVALVDPHPKVREAASGALQSINADVSAGLIERLTHPHPDVRRLCAEALGEMGVVEAISHLISLLDDETKVFWAEQKRICDATADALVKIGTLEAISSVETWWQKQEQTMKEATEK